MRGSSRSIGLLLLCGFLLLTAGARANDEDPEKPPPPKIKDVKVWYYPPNGEKPITLLWWEPDDLHVGHRMRFSRRGRFRARVEVEGGVLKDGELVNYVSIVFRDENSNSWDLPDERRITRNPIRDMYWRPPSRFASGGIDFQVALWNDTLPRVSLDIGIEDKTDFFILGVLEGH